MLWTYAPSETLDPPGRTRSICGTGGGNLQMDRLRRVGPLLRSARTRGREDRHQQLPERRNGLVHRPGKSRRAEHAEARGSGGGLRALRHYLACSGSDILRRRDHRRASGAGTGPQTGAKHHLASERSGTCGPGPGRDSIHSAALGSRHLCDRRDHHGSKDRLFSDDRQREFFRSTAFRIVAAAQVAPSPPARPHRGWPQHLGQADAPFGR